MRKRNSHRSPKPSKRSGNSHPKALNVVPRAEAATMDVRRDMTFIIAVIFVIFVITAVIFAEVDTDKYNSVVVVGTASKFIGNLSRQNT